jgi:hypothetical protein
MQKDSNCFRSASRNRWKIEGITFNTRSTNTAVTIPKSNEECEVDQTMMTL